MEFFSSSTIRHGPVCLWQYLTGYLIFEQSLYSILRWMLIGRLPRYSPSYTLQHMGSLRLAALALSLVLVSIFLGEFGPGECFFYEFGPVECFFMSLVLVSVFF